MVPYNASHWQSKIKKYLAEDWASRPSYFAKTVEKYLKPGSKVLELGAGAGQDGLWLENQGFDVVITDGDDVVFGEITEKSTKSTKPIKFDIQERFPFEDDSFDVVYAQLVLHYFDDDTMRAIFSEIERVLKSRGILACMVNSTNDPEYDRGQENADKLVDVNGLIKRYFTVETFRPYVETFEALVFDDKGRTPKDDAVNTSGMIQFIGRLK